ncbi:MMPL family transporter [Streptomyces radicis]|uniref:MMPL family transporter n=1 Tax=Streptomyces radicis TaxID=1750517 RepID=A0A3A9VTT4_9ACTN|nr:MMPL family transporter [Streptomyces radicis]RKN04405.1 MMPL family transporter [Streptomyces radicis]RKN15173.1 MMPL family transporter [Streptomyces radicis]
MARRNDARRGPLTLLGRLVARRGGAILLAATALLLGLGAYGAGAQADLDLARWDAPGTESVRAQDVLREEFGTGNPNLALLVTAEGGDVDAPAVAAAGRDLADELAGHPMVSDVSSYWDGGDPALRSTGGERALILARLEGSATETRAELADLSPELARDTPEISVTVGGQEEVSRQIGEQAARDFLTAEAIVLPSVLLLLILVYRRTVAALLTVGVGLFSVLGTMAGLRLLAQFTEVSTFAANLALVLGLGLGIDYSLFLINRYREERAAGRTVEEAVAHAVPAAGRTIVFSGVTVAVSLSTLLVFPFFFLSSFAYAGILVVATAVAGAVVVLPAALVRWGHRVDRPATGAPGRFWHRTALAVMRRPVLTGTAALAVLLFLASPLLGLRLGLPDQRTLPEGTSSRVASEEVREHFAAEPTDTIFVVTEGPADPAATAERAAALSRVDGVFHVVSPEGIHRDGERVAPAPAATGEMTAPDGTTRLSVVPTQEAMDGDVPGLVADIRAVPAPEGTLVGGYPAETTDFRATLLDRVPLVAVLILLITCGVLFLMTGSVLLPVKATVLNLLSLSVMFGALVWVFQDGNLSGVLGFTPTGSIEPSIPMLMFCVTYGLSMDYEVFLLARIKEEHDRTGDTRSAVAAGIGRTAPLITAAAGILVLTFATYATSGVVFLKELGIGTALVILADATLIRMVLLPVSMRLAGRANWWAPRPLRRLHARIGLAESPPPAPAPAPEGPGERGDAVLPREYAG